MPVTDAEVMVQERVAGRSGEPEGELPSSRPNVLLIVCDDLGYGDLGCYGASHLRTPALDELAAAGARFTSMYAAAPTCTPSRAGLLTGRQAVHVGLPQVMHPGDGLRLSDGVRTLADHLRSHGYRTGCFGKWHLGDLPENGPLAHGFDTYFGVPFSHDMAPVQLWQDSAVIAEDVDITWLSARYTDATKAFVTAADDAPFFAYLAFAMPHEPVIAERGFAGRSAAGAYGDVIEAIDHHVGRLLEALRDAGRLDDTIVAFTSDHGPRFTGSTGGLRGRKFETWDGGMRVPFLLRWPGLTDTGRVVTQPVSCLDVVPSVMAALGERVCCDGEDLRPLLTGTTADHGPIYFYDREHVNAVRVGRWKLHMRRHSWGGHDYNAQRALPQLHDMEADLGEEYNLAGAEPLVVAELSALIEREQSRSGHTGTERTPCTTPAGVIPGTGPTR